MEATTSRRSRFYEYLNLRPLFEKYFKEDPEFLWTAAPKPRLTDESYVENYYYLFEINDWELIPAAKPVYVHKAKQRLFGPYGETSWISMNTLSLGPNTICVEAHEANYIDQLTKIGFEVIPVHYDAVTPFGGALHCTTLDVYREGPCEDYFPKQIPNY